MRAVVAERFGPPSVLVATDVANPVAGPSEVVVDVELASITFVETQVRAGRPPNPTMAPALPAILGNGVGGLVAATGEGVDRALLGMRVITTTGGSGGYAERVAVAAAGVIPVPDGLGLADAVALLADGRTATGLVGNAGLTPGETVLVEAAGGGVGTLLVQLARHAGAAVVAAAAGAAKLELATSLGATATVDYTRSDWPDRVREAYPGGVDVAFDGVGADVGRAALSSCGRAGASCPSGWRAARSPGSNPARPRAVGSRSCAARARRRRNRASSRNTPSPRRPPGACGPWWARPSRSTAPPTPTRRSRRGRRWARRCSASPAREHPAASVRHHRLRVRRLGCQTEILRAGDLPPARASQ